MCGIVGIIAKDRMPFFGDDVFTELLRADTIRGEDSTGVFGVTHGNKVDIVKGNANGYIFTASPNYDKFKRKIYQKYAAVIGHNRKATKGSITPHNAHPFKEGNIYLVHNGMMRNANSVDSTVEVDSMAIAKALQQHNAVEGLNKIDGAYALVWYDQKDKTLNLARNSERPLFLLEYETAWIISSELGLPAWILGRLDHKCKNYRLIETKKILSFELNQRHALPKEIPYEEYSHYTPIAAPAYVPKVSAVPSDNNLPLLSRPKGSSKVDQLGTGSKVLVKVDNYKSESGVTVLLGHPVLGGEIDGNIPVRIQLKTHDALLPFVEAAQEDDVYVECTVQFWRQMSGLNILFANLPIIKRLVKDAGEQSVDTEELDKVLEEHKCKACNATLNLADLSLSILRKTSEGKWRVLCKDCLKSQQDKADQNKRAETLHVVH